MIAPRKSSGLGVAVGFTSPPMPGDPRCEHGQGAHRALLGASGFARAVNDQKIHAPRVIARTARHVITMGTRTLWNQLVKAPHRGAKCRISGVARRVNPSDCTTPRNACEFARRARSTDSSVTLELATRLPRATRGCGRRVVSQEPLVEQYTGTRAPCRIM